MMTMIHFDEAMMHLMQFLYKCSAVAEMGDRLSTIDMNRKLGAVPLLGEPDPHVHKRELYPHVTQCGLSRGVPSYQVAS